MCCFFPLIFHLVVPLKKDETVGREIISGFKLIDKCILLSEAAQPWNFGGFIMSFLFMCYLWFRSLFFKPQCQGWLMSAIFCLTFCSGSWQILSLGMGKCFLLLHTEEAHNSLKRQCLIHFLKGKCKLYLIMDNRIILQVDLLLVHKLYWLHNIGILSNGANKALQPARMSV